MNEHMILEANTGSGAAVITNGQIDQAAVVKTYNGQDGCACGCGGTYYVPSWNGKQYDYDEINDRAVKLRIRKINQELAAGREVLLWDFGDELCYETGQVYGSDRCTRVYVKVDK